MQRKYDLFLKDILDSIQDIKEFTCDHTFESFVKDKKTTYAVTRSFEVIGEAVTNIPESVKKQHPNVPWRDIKNFRNIIVHQYWRIDYEAAWSIIQTKIDDLEKQIAKILKKE